MKRISVNGPAYRGAPQPKFNSRMINESCFLDEERFKEAYAVFDTKKQTGDVSWLAQEVDEGQAPSNEWKNEVKRAFKANGAKVGAQINVEFSGRGCVDSLFFTLIVD